MESVMDDSNASGGFSRVRSLAMTAALMVGIAALAATAGYVVAGGLGAAVMLGLAVFSSYGGARYADRYVLRAMGARPLSPVEAPAAHNAVRDLSLRAGIPMPRLFVFPSDRPNAFTVGRDPTQASIAVSSGLLRRLDARGLTAVLAHEMAHIRHRDILLQSFAATVTQMLRSTGRLLGGLVFFMLPLVVLFAPKLLVVFALFAVAPLGALLLQNALSRQREFAADAAAARLSGDPLGLAAALARIDADNRSLLSRLFGFVPRGGTPLHSHPATEDRVARLREMARGMGSRPAVAPHVQPIRTAGNRVLAPIRVIRGHRTVPGRTARRVRSRQFRFVG
jgi:heat shock protein HtpX